MLELGRHGPKAPKLAAPRMAVGEMSRARKVNAVS